MEIKTSEIFGVSCQLVIEEVKSCTCWFAGGSIWVVSVTSMVDMSWGEEPAA